MLAIARRERFEKVYDLTERVLPGPHAEPTPSAEEHVAWACGSALERLGVATAREIAAFWNAVPAARAERWCAAGTAEGRLRPVRVAGDERRAVSYARSDWRDRAEEPGRAPGGVRLLSPFDPLVRDRDRCERLFGVRYRFEAFTPEAKREHGYYILPILEGERLIGRLDPRLDRRAGVLHVRDVWWERGVRVDGRRRRALGEALERYAAFCGAAKVEV